ncbi:hypothetical protein EDD22DRAFT_953541 [Suillus occidentalis]|nr:hypothetical protein EDD22DRAFT_953541 [Suillus occidentalis]
MTDSSWNWVRQDTLLMYYDIIHGRLTTVDRELTARCIALLNRADPKLLTYMQYNIDRCDASKRDIYVLAKQFGQQLIDNTKEVIDQPPVYKTVFRENVRKLEAYVEEMASGDTISPSDPNTTPVKTRRTTLKRCTKESLVPSEKDPELQARTRTRSRHSSSQFLHPQISATTTVSANKVPLLHLKRKIATSGITFKEKNALLTGVGKGYIGVEILKGRLSGGAHVVKKIRA